MAFQDDNGVLRLNSLPLFGPMHVMVFLFTYLFEIITQVKIKMSLCSPPQHEVEGGGEWLASRSGC